MYKSYGKPHRYRNKTSMPVLVFEPPVVPTVKSYNDERTAPLKEPISSFTPYSFTPICFNAPWQITPFLNFCPSIFGSTPFSWLRSNTLISYFWRRNVRFRTFYLHTILYESNKGAKQGLALLIFIYPKHKQQTNFYFQFKLIADSPYLHLLRNLPV